MARGAKLGVTLAWSKVPLLDGVAQMAGDGFVTGASGRNWESYGADVTLPDGFADVDRALLSDPQTSGGLLVACAPDAVNDVLGIFRADGFAQPAVIGSVTAGPARLTIAA
jgi:selenide,water dikinase